MNPDQLPFLKAIKANPDDDTLRLVYADWLEEQGDEVQAGCVRGDVELKPFVMIGYDSYTYRALYEDRPEDEIKRYYRQVKVREGDILTNRCEWFGIGSRADSLSAWWRGVSYRGGMVTLTGTPRELKSKVRSRLGPWVLELVVRGEAGGAHDLVLAVQESGARYLSFSEHVGSNVMAQRLFSAVRAKPMRRPLGDLTHIDLGWWVNDATFRHLHRLDHYRFEQLKVLAMGGGNEGDRPAVDNGIELTRAAWRLEDPDGPDRIRRPKTQYDRFSDV
jgi:uncharacterized protein (TIGR02996 family)